MIDLKKLEVWFVTGSQHLYGEETLKTVAAHSEIIAKALSQSEKIPVQVTFKPIVTTPDEIYKICQAANTDANCIGIVAWMHTFSPAKMWIRGLQALQKPICHLHTQFNRDIPWGDIDMDFMNLNQSAHGDREFGFMMTRLRLNRKVIVGHWADPSVHARLNVWMRAAAARFDWQGGKFCRFGDNMRQVAVTEGDKVEAEMKFGYSVNGCGVGDLVKVVNAVSDAEIDKLVAEYDASYTLAASLRKGGYQHFALRDAAKIELGMRYFLEDGDFKGFTDTFEDLHGMAQLPGIAAQRLGLFHPAHLGHDRDALGHLQSPGDCTRPSSPGDAGTGNLGSGQGLARSAHGESPGGAYRLVPVGPRCARPSPDGAGRCPSGAQ